MLLRFLVKTTTLIARVIIGNSLPLGRSRLRDSSPPIAVTLRFLPRLMEYLQSSFVRVEDISCEQFLAQLLIYRSQVILRSFQYPVRHGLPAQMDSFPVNLLFLTAQRRTHNELLGHDMGNGFRCGKAAEDDILLSGRFYNRSHINPFQLKRNREVEKNNGRKPSEKVHRAERSYGDSSSP